MSSFLPAPKFPWGRLIMLKGYEFRRPELVTPTWNILDPVLSQRLFKQRDQSSCTPMLRVQSFSLPSPQSLKGFNGSQFKIWLLFNPTSCCDSLTVLLTRVHSVCESFSQGAQPSRISMQVSQGNKILHQCSQELGQLVPSRWFSFTPAPDWASCREPWFRTSATGSWCWLFLCVRLIASY